MGRRKEGRSKGQKHSKLADDNLAVLNKGTNRVDQEYFVIIREVGFNKRLKELDKESKKYEQRLKKKQKGTERSARYPNDF